MMRHKHTLVVDIGKKTAGKVETIEGVPSSSPILPELIGLLLNKKVFCVEQ